MTNGSSRISYEGSHEVVKERGFNLVHILQSILEFIMFVAFLKIVENPVGYVLEKWDSFLEHLGEDKQ